MITTDSVSAPSPAYYSLGVGRSFSLADNFALQVHASFFTGYYLWDDEKAKPAEVENRTAIALSSLASLNAIYLFAKTEKQWFEIGAGPAILARYGLQANGVSGAEDEVSAINDYFWSDAQFFYPDISFSYNRIFGALALGAECRVYFPFASLTSGDGFENGMISIAFRLGKAK